MNMSIRPPQAPSPAHGRGDRPHKTHGVGGGEGEGGIGSGEGGGGDGDGGGGDGDGGDGDGGGGEGDGGGGGDYNILAYVERRAGTFRTTCHKTIHVNLQGVNPLCANLEQTSADCMRGVVESRGRFIHTVRTSMLVLLALVGWPSAGSNATAFVSCGAELAPSCSACGEFHRGADSHGGCGGDCTRSGHACMPLEPSVGSEPPFTVPSAAWQFDPSTDAVRVVETSPLASASLGVLLATGAMPAEGARGRCYASTEPLMRTPTAAATTPCLSEAALQTFLSDPMSAFNGGAVSFGSLPPRCRCPGTHRSGSWLHSWVSGDNITAASPEAPPAMAAATTPPSAVSGTSVVGEAAAPSAGASSATHLVALLRDPMTVLQAELLPHPSLCLPNPTSPRTAEHQQCSPSELKGVTALPPARRLRLIVACCANPLSRQLLSTLPPSEAKERCASGPRGCDPATMRALAMRALLRLSWFGVLEALDASLALLQRTMGVRTPSISPPSALADLKRPMWPSTRARLTRDGLGLTRRQLLEWSTASAVDVAVYRHAIGVLNFRVRALQLPHVLPPTLARATSRLTTVSGWAADAVQLAHARVFDTARGRGRAPEVVPPPIIWDRLHDTLVFVHIAKCGGTSFNRRLTALATGLPCECDDPATDASWPRHNGHLLVRPKSCECLRKPRGTFQPAWSSFATARLAAGRRTAWRFLQRQWLVSPETTGWLGGVHAPVRTLQSYLILAARLTSSVPLGRGIHYVALLRDPITRFLSEFYETYDGWERNFGTPPRLPPEAACSLRLADPAMRACAVDGIDKCDKAEYDRLFPHWLRCGHNMAANRQTRALAHASLASVDRHAGSANSTDGPVRAALCASLPMRAGDPGCSLRMARRALYQFSFIGLNDARCASERLLEAQFGLTFGRDERTAGAHHGAGAHKVAKLNFAELSADEQRRVRALNHDDLKLYAEAKQLFERRLRAFGIPRDVKCN